MKQKLLFFTSLATVTFLLPLFFMRPLEKGVEEMYKSGFYYSFTAPLLAFIVKKYFSFFKSKKWKYFFMFLFISSASSGLGILLKYFIHERISYLGLSQIIYSFMFLILSWNKKG